MKRGYARVSTRKQELRLQLDALLAAGCERIYTEKASGAKTDRPELAKLLAEVEPGDTLVVYNLSRLGRSLAHLLSTIEDLSNRGVLFESLNDKVDTTSASGRLVLHIFAAVAQFQREIQNELIAAGLTAAKARGRKLGRRTVLGDERISAVKDMLAKGLSVSQVARVTGVSRATLYRHRDALADAA